MRTISLHNIRYELEWRGNRLWKIEDGRESVWGSVSQLDGGAGWEATSVGWKHTFLPDEDTARWLVETAVKTLLARVTDLT